MGSLPAPPPPPNNVPSKQFYEPGIEMEKVYGEGDNSAKKNQGNQGAGESSVERALVVWLGKDSAQAGQDLVREERMGRAQGSAE